MIKLTNLLKLNKRREKIVEVLPLDHISSKQWEQTTLQLKIKLLIKFKNFECLKFKILYLNKPKDKAEEVEADLKHK